MFVKGDTVYKYQYKYQYRDKLIRDAVNISKRDSIPYPVEVVKTVYVEKNFLGGRRCFFVFGAFYWQLDL